MSADPPAQTKNRVPPVDQHVVTESMRCPCCGCDLDGPEHSMHEPLLDDLLREFRSGRQPPLAWDQQLRTCILPDLVWAVCGLQPNEHLTGDAVSKLRDRVIQQTCLTESDIGGLTIREAANLVDNRACLPRYALFGAWVQAQLLWQLSRKEHLASGTPLEVIIEEFAAAYRRLDASNLPAPWRTMLEWAAIDKTWSVLLSAGYGVGDLAKTWHDARPSLAMLAEQYKGYDDCQVTMNRLKKGPPKNIPERPSHVEAPLPRNPPDCPRPPDHLIEAALAAIPYVFAEARSPTQPMLETVLTTKLREKGHLHPTAKWAIHSGVVEGLLHSTLLEMRPLGGMPYHLPFVRPTEALWQQWRKEASTKGDNLSEAEVQQRRLPVQRLRIDGARVFLDEEPVPLNMTEESRGAALCLLRHLLDAAGEWRSSTELAEMESVGPCQDHVDVRWDRVRKQLPPCLLDLIETNRRKGSRLVLAAWRR